MFDIYPMITTKQKPIVDTQKIKRRELKHITMDIHQFKTKDNKREKRKNRNAKQHKNGKY